MYDGPASTTIRHAALRPVENGKPSATGESPGCGRLRLRGLSANLGAVSASLRGLPASVGGLPASVGAVSAKLRGLSASVGGLPFQPLKRRIVELMALRGVRCTEEQIFLTSGAQQGMDLLGRLLLPPGGQVLLERAIYDGIRLATRLQRPEILTVETDLATGMDVDEVEARLSGGARPSFLYSIPDGHNPLGVSLSPEKRRRLAGLARQHRMPVLEDDAYGFLYYGEAPPPPLRAIEDEWVYYLRSFS